jgi:hypothetical protein
LNFLRGQSSRQRRRQQAGDQPAAEKQANSEGRAKIRDDESLSKKAGKRAV